MSQELSVLDFETIEAYIQHFYPGLLEIIRSTSVVLSGSTVQYFKMREMGMSPRFVPSDLDVYHKSDETEGYAKLNKWFDEEFKDMDEFEKTRFDVSFYSGLPFFYEDFEYVTVNIPQNLQRIIRHVRPGISKTGRKVDCVLIHEEIYKGTPAEFIRDFFDFDFCKCYYDGREIHSYELDSLREMRCQLRNIPMISFLKLDPVNLVDYAHRIRDGSFPHHANRINDPANIFKRILKYQERGFTVDTSQLTVRRDDLEKSIYVFGIIKLNEAFRGIREDHLPKAYFKVNLSITAGENERDATELYKAKKFRELKIIGRSHYGDRLANSHVRNFSVDDYERMIKEEIQNTPLESTKTFKESFEIADERLGHLIYRVPKNRPPLSFERECQYLKRHSIKRVKEIYDEMLPEDDSKLPVSKETLMGLIFKYVQFIYSECFDKPHVIMDEYTMVAKTGLEGFYPLYELGPFIAILLGDVNDKLHRKYTLTLDGDLVTFHLRDGDPGRDAYERAHRFSHISGRRCGFSREVFFDDSEDAEDSEDEMNQNLSSGPTLTGVCSPEKLPPLRVTKFFARGLNDDNGISQDDFPSPVDIKRITGDDPFEDRTLHIEGGFKGSIFRDISLGHVQLPNVAKEAPEFPCVVQRPNQPCVSKFLDDETP